jgi:hypothetical protein
VDKIKSPGGIVVAMSVQHRSDGLAVAAVAQGLLGTGFAAAKINLFALAGAVFDGHKAAAFVGAVAKRLGFTLTTRTPPIVFPLFNGNGNGGVGGANWGCHGCFFLDGVAVYKTDGAS